MTLDLLDKIPHGAGVIGLLSGDEYTKAVSAFDRELLSRAGARIGLLLCADHDHADGNARTAARHFDALGAQATRVRHAQVVPDGIDLLYIGGGTPTELLDCLLSRPLGEQILDRWRAGLALAGASAGAMALSRHCLVPGPGDDKPTKWSTGLGPLEAVGLAVHSSTRPAAWLEQVAQTAPVRVLAIDDATGVILQEAAEPVVVGPGFARVVG